MICWGRFLGGSASGSRYGSGLPQLRGQMGNAESYAERLFNFPEIGVLPASAAERAIRVPLQKAGVDIDEAALDPLGEVTRGHAYFLQQWRFHTGELAVQTLIGIDAVERASGSAVAALDGSFFRLRLDRLTPKEKRYLRAMAELGPGPHRSGDIAACYPAKVTSLAPTRSSLISKGMIWSPSHGDTAFTVPMFDEFM